MYRFAMEFLKSWKEQPDRKPLVIRGARQVGKSSLARMFGNSNFDNIIEVNFEEDQKAAGYFKTHSQPKPSPCLRLTNRQPFSQAKRFFFLMRFKQPQRF